MSQGQKVFLVPSTCGKCVFIFHFNKPRRKMLMPLVMQGNEARHVPGCVNEARTSLPNWFEIYSGLPLEPVCVLVTPPAWDCSCWSCCFSGWSHFGTERWPRVGSTRPECFYLRGAGARRCTVCNSNKTDIYDNSIVYKYLVASCHCNGKCHVSSLLFVWQWT